MKADNVSLLEFIGASKRTFYIPVYQRNYDWKKSQCQTLFEDIEAIAASENRSSHFLGTIVYVEGDSNATFRAFNIIDGQQRLTTIMILLKAIVDTTEEQELKADIIETYLTNRRCQEDLRIKLKPMKDDAINFRRLIDGQIDEMEETQVLNNYRLFLQLIESSSLSPEQIYEGVQKLEIVYIELNEQSENPQLIFESLNSTGLDLTQADLIRNYLLMGKSYDTQTSLYEKYWLKLEKMLPDALISDYIRDFLTLKTGSIPNKDDVYNSFKKYCQGMANYDAEGFLDELTTYGEYYRWFKYCDCPNENVNKRLRHFQKIKSTVVYPFLLSIFEDCYLYHKIDETELCKTMDVVLSYVMRRLLCEMPTNALNKVFAAMPRDIEKFQNIPLSEKVISVLAEKKGKTIFPNDVALREHLLSRDAYEFPHMKFVLEEIERAQSKETVSFESLSIEHIMPQTLTAKWQIDLGRRFQEIYDRYLNCLGNLTLSGYNSELSNASFEDKKKLYCQSNVCITKSISQYSHWGEEEIMNRGEALIDAIAKIWACPERINSSSTVVDNRTEFDFSDAVNVTGRAPTELYVCGDTFSVTSWRGFMVQLCKCLYEYDPQVFRSLTKHNDFKGKSVRIIDSSTENMHAPEKIAEGLYIETNRSANDILNYCKLILAKFDDLEEECSYKLRPI